MAARTVPISIARQSEPLQAPPRRDITLWPGDSTRIALTVYDEDGDAAPMSVAYAAGVMWFGRDETSLGRIYGVVNPGAPTVMTFDIDGSQRRLCTGRHDWGIRLAFTDGFETTFRGVANVGAASYSGLASGGGQTFSLLTENGNPIVTEGGDGLSGEEF